LALAADDHCNDKMKRGHNGSDGSSPRSRLERYGKWSGTMAENLSYSRITGGEMMAKLYIDDGTASRGHRKNMVNPTLKLTGMAYCGHERYGSMIAIVYATGFAPNQHGISELKKRGIKNKI